jgi:hypothetical protein
MEGAGQVRLAVSTNGDLAEEEETKQAVRKLTYVRRSGEIGR